MGHCSEANAGELAVISIHLGYTELFDIPAVTSVLSRLVSHFWGTLCSSVKQIKAPYLFDWEQGIALYSMQWNWASSLSGGKFHDFYRVASGICGTFSS